MQFNGHPQKFDIVSECDDWAGTDSETYPIEAKTRSANLALDRIITLIMKSDATWKWGDANNTDLPIAVTDLIGGQDNYAFMDKHLKVVRVRIKGKDGKWVTLIARDRKALSDAILNASGNPKFTDKLENSIFLYPVPDYSMEGGLEIEYQRGSNYFTTSDTIKEPGFASNLHRLVPLFMARDYLAKNELTSRLTVVNAEIKDILKDTEDQYSDRDIDHEDRIAVKKSNRGIGSLAFSSRRR